MKWYPYPQYRDSGVEWLGEIPEHWEILRLKNITRFGYGDSLAANDRIPGDYDVYGSNGIVGQHEQSNTRAPCLIVGRKGSFGKVAYSEKPCFAIDTTYFIDSRLTRNHLRWLYYCLQWLRLDSFTKDSAVPGLAREDAYENLVPFCSEDEQHAIAAFLDRETARIDALIEKKKRQIELLQEKRAAVISHAVTKGLDPNVRMKDSGIEWLGEIPEHWDTMECKFAFLIQLGKMLQNEPQTINDEQVPYLKALHVQWENVNTLDLPEMWASPGDVRKYSVRDGDLLVCEGGEVGRAGILRNPPAKCIIQNALHWVRPKEDNCNRFLMYLLEVASYRGWFDILCNKATIAHFTGEKFGWLSIALPPPHEQRAIAAFLDRETAQIDALIEKIKKSIDLLREYRTALITAAVTGKIDVRHECQ